jgi:hypothetical protein
MSIVRLIRSTPGRARARSTAEREAPEVDLFPIGLAQAQGAGEVDVLRLPEARALPP